jgi:hypothetical protein
MPQPKRVEVNALHLDPAPPHIFVEPILVPTAKSGVPHSSSTDPLHGVTLERMLTQLVEHYGWPELGQRIEIRCFNFDPSIKSSLKFLRKTPWARQKVEELYIRSDLWRLGQPGHL